MTRLHEDPRLTAHALGELGAEEQRQFEQTLAGDPAARLELEEIGRVAALVERELAGPTGLGLSARQKLQLQWEWQARSASVLEEFARPERGRRSGRGRFAKALLAAVLLHGTAAAALVLFPSTASELVEELEAVDFAPRASPESPRVSVAIEAPPSLRPKRVRPALPVEVSDDELTEEAASSPSGSSDGAEPGTASHLEPAPRPLAPEPLTPPVALGGASIAPKYPVTAQRKDIEGTVVVTFDVLEDGSVTNVKAVTGPPELFESVIRAVESWRFRPALRGGKPVRYSMTKAVTFRLEGL